MTRRLWLIGLVLLLAIPLVLLLREFTQDVLLIELLRVVWAARILLASLPQLPLWLFFVLIALLVAVRSLLRGGRPQPVAPEAEAEYQGRIFDLARRLRRIEEGDYFRWHFSRYLGTLTIDVLAHQQRITPEEIRQRLRTERLDAPPEIQAYLRQGLIPIHTLSVNPLSKLRRLLSPGVQAAPLDEDVETVIRFLEDQLEV